MAVWVMCLQHRFCSLVVCLISRVLINNHRTSSVGNFRNFSSIIKRLKKMFMTAYCDIHNESSDKRLSNLRGVAAFMWSSIMGISPNDSSGGETSATQADLRIPKCAFCGFARPSYRACNLSMLFKVFEESDGVFFFFF